jgi:hypothetical protein
MIDKCVMCDKPADWVRVTQFAGKHPYCDSHAVLETDFGKNDSYEYWNKIATTDAVVKERIKVLAEQVKNDMPKDSLAVDQWIEEYNQKFARVVAAECAAICDLYAMPDGTSTAAMVLAAAIRHRFGVEE